MTAIENTSEISGAHRAAARHHVASIDGLRALAVLAVMGHHFGFPPNITGWLGVDVFFALSGFLITTLLCREYENRHTIALLRFWMRRFCRLMPAYWIYIGCVTALLIATRVHTYHTVGGWTPGWFAASLWGYFINFVPAGVWDQQSLTFHLWSLALEEQFYFVWPLICLFLLRFRSAWLIPFSVFVLFAVLQRYYADRVGGAGGSYLRGMGILAGCSVALYWREAGKNRGIFAFAAKPAVRNLWLFIFLATVVCCEIYGHRFAQGNETEFRGFLQRYFVPPLVIIMSLAIAGLWYGTPDVVSRALSWRPLAYIGTISYGMYLYHMACRLAVKALAAWSLQHGFKIKFYLLVPLFILLVIGVASLSYWFVERPFLAIKERFRSPNEGKPLPGSRESSEVSPE